ncbi:MAG: hypothetical protein IT190_05005 [Microbacteriaceae bacterium]|nr:hypothetical protein [Microbacteriaceae bacterium]
MSERLHHLEPRRSELFQIGEVDLAGGIYRNRNQKCDDVIRFLGNDPLPPMREAFKQ